MERYGMAKAAIIHYTRSLARSWDRTTYAVHFFGSLLSKDREWSSLKLQAPWYFPIAAVAMVISTLLR